ncbi:DUF4440 domain-containing protein [Amycolatopsis magusensis]|uniref:DUF4440 domain-containing protein n=1 Tax=Amycolatopsis magusensis TaxID=882444 RepID=A0ABS4PT02_9PSEU|nr:DUF4440 domain-containing protein [Amycolatopsis magusensis]MBP2182560.1 hypothetical protein [Amycolatopsis magusensis]
MEHAQQHELVDEFVGLFRAGAIWTTGGGRRLFGRDEIAAFTRQVLPGGMKGLRRTMDSNTDGVPREDEGEGTPLFVMSREDGQWRPAACQNTTVLG